MNRRDFNAMMFGGIAASALPKRWPFVATPQADLRVNDTRINTRLAALAEFGKNPQGGVSRVAYSDFDKAARAVVMDWMREAKLDPAIDYAGNIIGRRRGSRFSLDHISIRCPKAATSTATSVRSRRSKSRRRWRRRPSPLGTRSR